MLVIIVINYKTEQKTIDYVKKELCKISMPHKTIIVNNGATKESDNFLSNALSATLIHDIEKKCLNNDYYVISNNENSGFAIGNNLGATFAKLHFPPDYILFSNNDIRLISDNVVENLIEKLKDIPEAGIIGPKVIGLKGELQSPEPFHSFWDRHVWMYLSTPFYSKKRKIRRFQLDYTRTAQEGFHYKVMGAFFIVKANDFYECGMMDSNTFLYAEETILAERMKSIGKKVYYYPQVTVLHEHGATTQKHLKRTLKNKFAFQSECYYYKHYIKTSWTQILIGKFVFKILSFIK